MPGDTKISKTVNGWIDNDNPGVFYPVRRLAREARRLARGVTTTTTRARRPRPIGQPRPSTVAVGPGATTTPVTLTSLQQRLYDRLTGPQGVSAAEAQEVILANGYNKAASYGYMRAAGATHDEAKAVIAYESPTVSLAYGIARAQGKDHNDAFNEAYQAHVGLPTVVDSIVIHVVGD